MKILHLIGGELSGGAARGAYTLHRGLIESGVDSMVLTDSRDTLGDQTVVSCAQQRSERIAAVLRTQLDVLPAFLYRHRQRRLFSTGITGVEIARHALTRQADIVHLHWINGGFVNVGQLRRIGKPLVWTMRDMWPMTGGCHYALACDRYVTGCGACPQLGSSAVHDLSRWVAWRKRRAIPQPAILVGISRWLAECARRSWVLNGFDTRSVPNAIDCAIFSPIERTTARQVLGLPHDTRIVLAGAQNHQDHYKGFNELIAAVDLTKNNFLLVLFGKSDPEASMPRHRAQRAFGVIRDDMSLRLLYSAADVFVAPSTMEAFGKTLAEAMACGTPVVAYNATGPRDIVDHMENGYLTTPFEPADLARGIDWILEHPSPSALANSARAKIVSCFEKLKIARRYIDLYEEVLAREHT